MNNFKMKDLKELKLLLGIEIERNENEIRLYQRNYIQKILERFEMENCRPVDTPIESQEAKAKNPNQPSQQNAKNPSHLKYQPKELNDNNNKDTYEIPVQNSDPSSTKAKNPNQFQPDQPKNLKNNKIETYEEIPFQDPNLYRQAVGCLNYLANTTRPDISFATNSIARHVNAPLEKHWSQIKRIFRYLKGTINYALVYSKIKNDNNDFHNNNSNNNIIGYSDASYAPNFEDRKSIGAYIFLFNNGPISWSTKKQPIIALSSCEAEYIALTECAKESLWLGNLHRELNPKSKEPFVLFEDNQASIKIASNNIFSNRTKHVDVKYHFIRDLVNNKKIKLIYCPTNFMIADALTKGLLKVKFNQLRKSMGILNCS